MKPIEIKIPYKKINITIYKVILIIMTGITDLEMPPDKIVRDIIIYELYVRQLGNKTDLGNLLLVSCSKVVYQCAGKTTTNVCFHGISV